jgi:electron transfer flavoprotein alpha subunit
VRILVFVEARGAQVKHPSLEAVSEARRCADRLGDTCAAVVVGSGVGGLAAEIGRHGAQKIFAVDHASLANYAPEAYAKAVVAAAADTRAIFFAATAMGKDLAPTVGAALGAGVATDCTEVRTEGGTLTARRPACAGKLSMTVGFKKNPAILSLRPNVFAAQELGGASSAEPLSVEIGEAELRSAARETVRSAQGKVELTEASVIVSGGRGLKGPEGFKMRTMVAQALGAAEGASRAVVDAGWRPYAEQVGQTGKTVSPNLYVALGISGAIQHLAGMSSSKVIVAVNKDPEAPIFKLATYGIVGDVFEVCPVLAEELSRSLGR